jgi:hypothetical protein
MTVSLQGVVKFPARAILNDCSSLQSELALVRPRALTAVWDRFLEDRMKPALIAAAAVIAFSSGQLALAQNKLPTTTVTAPKPKARPVVTAPTKPITGTPSASAPIGAPDAQIGAADAQKHFTYDPSVHSKDWNAPGVVNVSRMTDAEFAAFEMRHPTAVFLARCYLGQDPDLQIRARIRMYARPYASWCGGY